MLARKSHIFFTLIFSIFLASSLRSHLLFAEREIPHLIAIGGGYMDGRMYNGGAIQIEFKYGRYLWKQLRPQAIFLLSQYEAGFIGAGLCWEFYLTKEIVLIPSFCPGFYWKGNGRDLGCPLEFRSAFEISYELQNKIRIGAQVSHVSNAHLSHRNPGFNCLTLNIAFPLKVY